MKDAGKGLTPVEMKALGKPFMRIREPGKEGFPRDGQGLGLSLLAKVAEQEGWGLLFSSVKGQGVSVTLEIQAG